MSSFSDRKSFTAYSLTFGNIKDNNKDLGFQPISVTKTK